MKVYVRSHIVNTVQGPCRGHPSLRELMSWLWRDLSYIHLMAFCVWHLSASGGPQLASGSGAGNGSPVPQTETSSRSIPPVRGEESTALWFSTSSEPFAGAAGSSTSHPEVVNASVLTRFSASAPQSRGSDPALYEMSYSELATESLSSSSSESLGFLAPRGERSSESPSTEPHPRGGWGAAWAWSSAIMK